MMRCMITYHFSFRVKDFFRRKELHQKKVNNATKIRENLLEHMNENTKYEQKLILLSGTDNYDIITTNRFFSIK